MMNLPISAREFKRSLLELESRFKEGSGVALNAEELNSLNQACTHLGDKHTSYRRLINTAVAVSAFAILMTIAEASVMYGVLMCFLLLCAMSIAYPWLEATYFEALKTQAELVPLKDPEACVHALWLAENCAACADYRKQVLQQSREFVQLDVSYMQLLFERAKKEEADQVARQKCKALYDISN